MRTPQLGLSPAAPVSWAALDVLPVGIAQLSADGRVVRVNARLAEMLGLDDRTAPGIELADLDLERSFLSPQTVRLSTPSGAELVLQVSLARFAADDPEAGLLATIIDVTAEHQANQDLRAERDHYRILADQVADIILVHEGEEIVWASPSVRQVLGCHPQDLVGCTFAHLTVAEDYERLPPPPRPGEVITTRLRLRTADGSLRWFQARVTARWPLDQQPVLFVSLRDIDAQVRVESALKDSEWTVRCAFEASPDAWVIMVAERCPDGEVVALRFVRVNPAALRDMGRSEAEAIGCEVVDILSQPQAEELRRLSAVALDSDQRVQSQFEMYHTGDRHIFQGFMVGLDRNTLLCSWRNVTEMVEAQELLNRAYEETAEMRVTLQTALDATSDGFAVYSLECDEQGELISMRVVHANTAGAESLGMIADDLIGMELHEFFPEVRETGLWERIVVAAATKEPQHHRVQMHDADGTWCSAWDNTVAPVGEERMAITWRDVSNEERAIRQLAQTRDEAMYSATHDALTDLPNRILLQQHLQEALANCRPEERVGVVFVDLDRFKSINDSYGHAAGDTVLKETASRLGRLVRHGDLAARLAGDEFVLVLTALPSDWSPEQFFARASAMLSEPVWAEEVELTPSASLGAVLANPRRLWVEVDELIKRADAEMYQAKAAKQR